MCGRGLFSKAAGGIKRFLGHDAKKRLTGFQKALAAKEKAGWPTMSGLAWK